MSPQVTEISLDHLLARMYHRSKSSVVIVFSSFNAAEPGNRIEEFRNTLWEFDVSICFVTDISKSWYVCPCTTKFFCILDQMFKEFENVAVMGESMGAFGALLFAQWFPRMIRVMGFSPQYYNPTSTIEEKSAWNKCLTDLDKGNNSISQCVLMFGNISTQDAQNSEKFEADGLPVLIVNFAPHEVASHIRRISSGNRLKEVMCQLLNFSTEFSSHTLKQKVDLPWTRDYLNKRSQEIIDLRNNI